MKRASAEVASMFGAADLPGANMADEVYPGYPGIVVREQDGTRTLQSMTWGIPRPMKSKRTGLPIKPKAVNNARDDKLMTPFWRNSFEKRRCLIPVSQWAEAEGEERKSDLSGVYHDPSNVAPAALAAIAVPARGSPTTPAWAVVP